jgi:hypothetical protein
MLNLIDEHTDAVDSTTASSSSSLLDIEAVLEPAATRHHAHARPAVLLLGPMNLVLPL